MTPHGRHVEVLDTPAQRVGQQLLGRRRDDRVRGGRAAPAAGWPGRRAACRRRAGPRRRPASPPSASRHLPIRSKFSSAKPIGSMTAWHDAQLGLARCCSSRWRTDVACAPGSADVARLVSTPGRRRRHRRAEQVLENPLAALHRRRAVAGRRDRQDAAVTEQPAARAVGQRDAPEAAAADVGDAVVPREPLVDERVVGVEQIERCCDPRGRWSRTAAPSRAGTRSAGCRRTPSCPARRRRAAAASSHCPARLSTSARARHRRASAASAARAPRARRDGPLPPRRSSSSSGMLLHRKNDSREASSRSLIR